MSSSACIFSITRLLCHFDEQNTQKFKQRLMKELECTNESQFLCKVIRSLSHSMSNESLTTLKQEAIKLSEQQQSKTNDKISIYKEIQQKYNDGGS